MDLSIQTDVQPERSVPALVIAHWPALAMWIVTSGALVIHARGYMPFFVDDGFISLRYSQRLLDGHGLTWTEGAPVEGYSNLLWVLLVAVPGALGAELLPSARVVGVLCTLAILGALARDLRSLRTHEQGPMWLAGGVVASSGSVAAWAIGGLEQPLVMALLCWALVLLRRHIDDRALGFKTLWPIGALLALVTLARVDGAIYVATIALSVLALRGFRRGTFATAWRTTLRDMTSLLILPTLTVLGQLAFRFAYYDDWVPNTFRVKVAPTLGRLTHGYEYLVRSADGHGALIVAGLLLTLVALTSSITRRRTLPVLLCWLTWTVYITCVGGDFFPHRRQLLPSLVLLAWLMADGVMAIVSLRGRWTVVGSVLGLALLTQHGFAQFDDPQRKLALNETWHWGGAPIGRFLDRHFGTTRPLLAVDAAGSLPFYSELPCLDLLGLNDRYLARHRPAAFGNGFVGHELGDADYVLTRKPDLIALWGPHGSRTGRWKAGIDLLKKPEFQTLYVDVEFRTPTGERSVLWTRREGRVGVQRSAQQVIVPGYLMTQVLSFAHEDAGRLGLVVSGVRPAHLRHLALGAGIWSLTAEGVAVEPLSCSVSAPGRAVVDRGRLPLSITLDQPTESLHVMCTIPKGEWAHVAQLTFRRADPWVSAQNSD